MNRLFIIGGRLLSAYSSQQNEDDESGLRQKNIYHICAKKIIIFLVQDFCACFSTNRDDFMLKTKKINGK